MISFLKIGTKKHNDKELTYTDVTRIIAMKISSAGGVKV